MALQHSVSSKKKDNTTDAKRQRATYVVVSAEAAFLFTYVLCYHRCFAPFGPLLENCTVWFFLTAHKGKSAATERMGGLDRQTDGEEAACCP